jgi:hypothetical protein
MDEQETFKQRLAEQANDGRRLARQAIRESIAGLLERARDQLKTGENISFDQGYFCGLQDGMDLFLGTDPLHCWEVDCRKGHRQWGNRTPGRTKVLLDGEEVKFCVAADSKRGMVMVIRRDPNGKPVLDGSNKPAHECLEGKVELEDAEWLRGVTPSE